MESNQRTRGQEIWREKWAQQVSGTAGGRWRRQHQTELAGDKYSLWCMYQLERQGLSQVIEDDEITHRNNLKKKSPNFLQCSVANGNRAHNFHFRAVPR